MRPVMPNIAMPDIGAALVDCAGEELLHAVEEGLLPGLMAAGSQRNLELLEQLLLFMVQADRCFDHHAAEQVPGRSAAHRLHALLPNPEYAAGLGLGRNLQDDFAVKRRYFHRPAERCSGKAHRHLAGEMAAFPLEDGVLANPDFDIQVAGGTAVSARLTLAVQADPVTGIDPRGHRHRQRLLLAHAALAVAGIAGIADDLAAALAARTGLLDGKNGLLHPHLPLAVAGIAGLRNRALGRTRSLAGLALGERRNLDLGFGTEYRLLEVELQLVAQIRAAKYLRSAALASREDVAEHFP